MMRIDPGTPDSSIRMRSSRVPRACDRCRIRKIKCNGRNQCSRCNLDDAICIYTKRKRPQDKAYSKEYVQLLEEQQTMLINGIKELYRRSRAGETLPELNTTSSDQTLIQDVLQSLNVLTDEKEASGLDWNSSLCDETEASSTRHSICSESILPRLSSSPGTSPSQGESPNGFTFPNSNMMQVFPQSITDILAQQQPTVTPKASEYTFAEAFSDVFIAGAADWPDPGLDSFIDPCETTFDMFTTTHNSYPL